ncbi:hypothetical protein SmJEL517_g04074 [Synchytrium microbalum]|uniref:Cytochrome P450 n=1 Tax=Synchytrium microbalum TaxID=1806994 RepID=A0A507C5X7_9FUNG|nr:uncharacterized protein SmJEL517_g04074 [Synchytrium microbalum]TPX32875.1 hypothetical protein SmJEL517_g04074 [Synchytrium microbalum]
MDFAKTVLKSPLFTRPYTVGASVLIGALLYEQIRYRAKKAHLPGPSFTIPLIGSLLESLYPSFEGYLNQWKSGALSVVSVFQYFIVIASTCDLSRKILSSPNLFEPVMVGSMKDILDPHNWVFKEGKDHIEYRKSLNVLFTRKALGGYLGNQERAYRKNFADWLASSGVIEPYQNRIRNLNMDTSISVFCGDYISEEVTLEISEKFRCITAALDLVNFPLALPGTRVWHAIQARKYIVHHFEIAASKSKARMEHGEPVTCLMDAWIQWMLGSQEGLDENGVEDSPKRKDERRSFSDNEIALTVLTFLFASQDATTSGLTWCFQYLADYPDVLAKVRAEVDGIRKRKPEIWGADESGLQMPSLSLELVDELQYTRAVIKEVLRVRPPVLMIPYKAKSDITVDETSIGKGLGSHYPGDDSKSWFGSYTIPKDSMVIPSFWFALHDPDVYPNPDDFDPERFLNPKGFEANAVEGRNYMVFGCGNHYCLGREYAVVHMTSVMALAASCLNWEHVTTPDSNRIKIFATTYPMDGCLLRVTPRTMHSDRASRV